MKRRHVILIISAVIAAGIFFGSGVLVGATTTGAGSQNDPVVTLSYLEYRFSKLVDELGRGVSSASGGSAERDNQSVNSGDKSAVNHYREMNLAKNDSLYPGKGSSIIIYSGNAMVIGKEGLVDMTGGELFTEGCSTVLYHEFLVPSDNCGIQATGNLTVYVCN